MSDLDLISELSSLADSLCFYSFIPWILYNFANMSSKHGFDMNYRKSLLLIFLSVVACVAGVAQPYCDVQTFTMRDGLAASTISRFVQTKNGLMWFSTWNGLCCYDGYRFTTFRNQPGVSEVLTTNRIFLIKPSATGDVWCCTYDRHVYLFDTRSCRFINVGEIIKKKFGADIVARNIYSLENGHTWIVSQNGGPSYRIDDARIEDGDGIEMYGKDNKTLRSNRIKKIELDADGREWIFDDKGVTLLGGPVSSNVPFEYMVRSGRDLLFATADGRVSLYAGGNGSLRPLPMPAGVNRINSVARIDSLRIVFATDIGVLVRDHSTGRTQIYPVRTKEQPSANVLDIFVDSRGRIWASTESAGVVMIDTRGGQTRWLMAKADNAITQTTSDKPFFHEDKYGTVWAVPKCGTFCFYNETERRLEPYVLRAKGGSSMYQPSISKFIIDNEKNLWFTGARDVNLVNFRYHHFKYTPVLPNQDVRSLLIDSHGRTWAGTANGHLAVFDANRHLLGYVNRQGLLQSATTEFSDRIYALCEDSVGRIWIGTKGNGLYVLGKEGGVEHFVFSQTDKYSVSHNDIYDIDIDRRGRIWVASFEGGLNLVDEQSGKIRFINHRNRLKQYPQKQFNKIRRVTHDRNGSIILSTNSGLVTFADDFREPEEIAFYTTRHVLGDSTSLMAGDVLQTLVTRDGHIIVATLAGGVQQMTSESPLRDNLKFRKLANVKPYESIVQSVAEDNSGNIWIIRESSIERYNPATGAFAQYGPNNIGHDVEMSEARPVHNSKTDAISVGVWGGYVSFNSTDLKKSNHSPNIVFTGVLYQGDNEMEPILNREVIDVPSDRRNLTVYFAALEYSDKYLVKYAYKLDGIDTKWNYVGAANSASFNYLPAGRYKLLVKSTNCDGVWMDNVAAIDIYAHPTFWETGWAKLLYLLLFCALICVALYIYNLRSRARMVRELSDMKTKFFTEISHKLRTPLTLIGAPVAEVLNDGSLTESARKHLEMVQRNASRMLELVNSMLKYSMERGVYISEHYKSADDGGGAKGEPAGGGSVAAQSPVSSHPVQKEKILVVEDNDDLRAFLVSILHNEYTVLQAENGQRGLEIAETEMPDFVITDVMMPVMDGLTMVRCIKRNNDICHIPIIVLSAKASLEDRLQGLDEGIDDYITKPFSAIYLKSRVSNIIRQRHMLQQAYVEQIKPDDRKTYKLEAPQIVDADNEMMKRLLGYIEERIGDPTLKIEDLAEAVNLGRSVFYGKIKSIVGMTPVDFVRHIRMQRAEELISRSNYPFSQIAYMVGFSDPKYFSKCFKKETGMTPSEYREKNPPKS